MYSGDEYNRDLLEARMLVNHVRQLKAIQVGHAHIHKNDGNLILKEKIQRLFRRSGGQQILPQLAQYGLIAEQLAGLIVHHQDVDGLIRESPFSIQCCKPEIIGEARCAEWRVIVPCLPVLPGIPMRLPPMFSHDLPSSPLR